MVAHLWWLMHKDLVSELRARRTWPAMLVLGAVVALVFSLQADLPTPHRHRIAGSLLWLAIFFAGMLAVDRSLSAEHEEDCWVGLLLYPLPAGLIYLAKLTVNVIALAAVQCVLIPLFIALCDVPLFAHPAHLLAVAALGNVGIAAIGTLLSAVASEVKRGGHLLVTLLLPLVVPVLLAAGEATRLIAANELGPPWWRWVQLLAGCAAIFVTTSLVLFEFVIEE